MIRFPRGVRGMRPKRAGRSRLLLRVEARLDTARFGSGHADDDDVILDHVEPRIDWQTLWWADAGDAKPRWQALTPEMEEELERLRQRLQRSHGVLLLDATETSHFHLAVPPGLRRREWATLLEEQVCGDGEPLTLHPLSAQRGELEVVAVSHARLQAWQSWTERLGLTVASWATPFMAQPEAQDTGHLSVMATDHHWLLKALGEPLAGQSTRHRQWLAWPRDWPLTQLPPTWQGRAWLDASEEAAIETSALPEMAWPTADVFLERLPATLPRLPRPERQGNVAPQRLLPRLANYRLGLATVALGLLLGVITLIQWQMDRRYQASDEQAALAARFEEKSSPENARRRLQQRLEALGRLQQRNQQIAAFQVQLADRFDTDEWQLVALTVDKDRMISEWERLGETDSPPPTIAGADASWRSPQQLEVSFPLDNATVGDVATTERASSPGASS